MKPLQRVCCLIGVLVCVSLQAQVWKRYSQREAENLSKFQAMLETNADLKQVYEQYRACLKEFQERQEADTKLQSLLRQQKTALDDLAKLRSNDMGGSEVSHQNYLLSTLQRNMQEHFKEIAIKDAE